MIMKISSKRLICLFAIIGIMAPSMYSGFYFEVNQNSSHLPIWIHLIFILMISFLSFLAVFAWRIGGRKGGIPLPDFVLNIQKRLFLIFWIAVTVIHTGYSIGLIGGFILGNQAASSRDALFLVVSMFAWIIGGVIGFIIKLKKGNQ